MKLCTSRCSPGRRISTSPSNMRLSLRKSATEGAVSTLERMLIYTPSTPHLKLELGIHAYKATRIFRGAKP